MALPMGFPEGFGKDDIAEMTSKLIKTDNSYKAWITELKQRIRQPQIKAALKVNVEMLHLCGGLSTSCLNRLKCCNN